MTNLKKIFELFPYKTQILESYEKDKEEHFNQAEFNYGYFHKIFDSFIYLFSDDLTNTISIIDFNVHRNVILYSELIKRYRSSWLIANKGYIYEALAILRSVYELNVGINAIHNRILTFEEYVGISSSQTTKNENDSNRQKRLKETYFKLTKKISKFNYSGLLPSQREGVINFENNLHMSVHKSYSGIVNYLYELVSLNKARELFVPDVDENYYGAFLNYASLLILMTLKNLEKERFVKSNNLEKLEYLKNNIEFAYKNSDDLFHQNVMLYIKEKF